MPAQGYPVQLTSSMPTHYDVRVETCEGGEMFALGHTIDRRVLAAFNAEYRKHYGGPLTRGFDFLGNVPDGEVLQAVAETLQRRWAVYDHEVGFIDWSAKESDSDSFPVTVWEP